MRGLVLSLFPGVDLLGMAFEEAGFCVVRGPDLIFGGDIHTFRPPPGRFDGVIGGPPCQRYSAFSRINTARGLDLAPDLIPEFARCIDQARPAWWIMENAPAVPDLKIDGYLTRRQEVDNRWFGERQARRRAFQFGTEDGRALPLSFSVFDHPEKATTCLASEGGTGRVLRKQTDRGRVAHYTPRRSWPDFLELQGLPPTFLEDSPFTVEGKYKAVGNGVPLAMGRAVAGGVITAMRLSAS